MWIGYISAISELLVIGPYILISDGVSVLILTLIHSIIRRRKTENEVLQGMRLGKWIQNVIVPANSGVCGRGRLMFTVRSLVQGSIRVLTWVLLTGNSTSRISKREVRQCLCVMEPDN